MNTMNSAEDLPSNIINDCSDNESTPAPDPNANLRDPSRGAIPKKTKSLPTGSTKPMKSVSSASSTSKKNIKLNNNIENMSTLNTTADEVPKVNGVTSNGLCTNHYLNDLLEPSCSSRDVYCKFDVHERDTASDSDAVDNDSDADTELLSVSEDGCIYTYKGDNNADLPSSFFDIPPEIPENQQDQLAVEEVVNRQDASSPEMDYLEMDFDPSNNGDGDSASENEMPMQEEEEEASPHNEEETANNLHDVEESQASTSGLNNVNPTGTFNAVNVGDASPLQEIAANVERWVENNASVPLPVAPVMTPDEGKVMPWSCTLAQRTKSKYLRYTKRVHCSRGELISPSEVPSTSFKIVMVRPESLEEPAMIWSREEANLKQVTQIGPSSCGATAVLNVLNALRFPVPSLEKLREFVTTRMRENNSPLTKYLMSRSRAGSTHKDLIDGLHEISNGTIYARFFHMYPERVVNLYKWLGFWITNGAVPIATLNLQKCVGTIPDAWHHQMIYGVDSIGIHLTNPMEHVEAGLLWPQLCSESVLMVRRSDVLSRWNFNTDLPDLMRINDVRWQRLNVVGQVANVVHENSRELRQGFTNTSHIRIPAAYSSGITLATSVNSPAYALLKQAPELPLLGTQDAASN